MPLAMWPLMANGWSGTHEDWERLQAPLIQIDSLLYEFSWSHGAQLSKNQKGYPERSIVWGSNPHSLIQIYPESEDGAKWNLWLCCYLDRGGDRYWRNKFAVRDKRLEDFASDLPSLLEASFSILTDWMAKPSQLSLVPKRRERDSRG